MAAAASADSLLYHAWRALGTDCCLQCPEDYGSRAQAFFAQAVNWVEQFEARYSRFRNDSLLSAINREAGRSWVEVDAETESLFALCDGLHFTSRGVLDPTHAPLVKLWYKRDTVPTDVEIASAKERTGWHRVERQPGKVRLPEGMELDFGGFGKEYAVDQVALIAERHGIADFLIDFGRDLRVRGAPRGKPCWHLGIEDPRRPGEGFCGVGLIEGGMAASGDYQRYFVSNGIRYGHIIDPRTGYPVAHGLRAVHVIAGDCLQAGLHSTSAFIHGIPDGLELLELTYGMEGLFISEDNQWKTTQWERFVVS